ncbi:MAG: hypothetical protein WHT45_11850 [Ignavibacterium sp.]
MMKKRIEILLLIIVLLVSTTGLQVYKHICSSHNFAEASLLETPLCVNDLVAVAETDDCCKMEEVVEYSCCEDENSKDNYPVSYSTENTECCISIVENNKIDDSIYPPLDKKSKSLEISVISSIDTKETENQFSLFSNSTRNDLPPPIFGRQLLQTIHQLKIDTPIC